MVVWVGGCWRMLCCPLSRSPKHPPTLCVRLIKHHLDSGLLDHLKGYCRVNTGEKRRNNYTRSEQMNYVINLSQQSHSPMLLWLIPCLHARWRHWRSRHQPLKNWIFARTELLFSFKESRIFVRAWGKARIILNILWGNSALVENMSSAWNVEPRVSYCTLRVYSDEM